MGSKKNILLFIILILFAASGCGIFQGGKTINPGYTGTLEGYEYCYTDERDRAWEEDILYVDPQNFDLKEGERVRILGGPFVDAEGLLVKIKGCRSKRVVVSLDDFLHVATAVVPISLIEKIK